MKSKILVIEDVPEMAQLVCMYMENAGFESLSFETAELALDKLRDGYVPDLILLDLNLPGMSGLDFLKKFREEFKTIIPVIIVSARDADEDIIASESPDAAIITVKDTGCGIEEKDLDHIFDLFYRGTNSRREQGMGIGLSVVKTIIDTHGWKINVNSKVGEGTSFIITIPLETPQNSEESTQNSVEK